MLYRSTVTLYDVYWDRKGAYFAYAGQPSRHHEGYLQLQLHLHPMPAEPLIAWFRVLINLEITAVCGLATMGMDWPQPGDGNILLICTMTGTTAAAMATVSDQTAKERPAWAAYGLVFLLARHVRGPRERACDNDRWFQGAVEGLLVRHGEHAQEGLRAGAVAALSSGPTRAVLEGGQGQR